MNSYCRTPLLAALALWLGLLGAFTAPSMAQDPAPADLEKLVGPIALYPDDLLSIVLPASTVPLQVVEADRWLAKNKGNKDAKPKDSWDDAVKALINYPEVIAKMSDDLDWTSALGEAVATDQTAVMDAVQSFRRKAEGAGNLKSDEKQIVVVEKEVVKIVQADPQVIYVPQYQPQTVIVQQAAPYYPSYYPTPYPVYYYPYPPGYAFAAGVFWGAAAAYAFDWHGGGIHGDVDINVNRNTNINNTNINNRATNIDSNRSQQLAKSNKGNWQSKQSPANVRSGRTSPTASQGLGLQNANRSPGGAQAANRGTSATGAAANRGAGTAADRGAGAAATQRSQAAGSSSRSSATASKRATSPSNSANSARYQNASRSGSTARASPPSRDAFSGMGSSRSTGAQSSRGSISRGGGRGGGGGRR